MAFYTVYVREAHPTDGWRSAFNDAVGIQEAQPTTFEGRVDVAQRCNAALEIAGPVLVDTIDNAVCDAYSGFPDRLYIVDRDGNIAYKSGRGPFGYRPLELEQVLNMMLLDQASTTAE